MSKTLTAALEARIIANRIVDTRNYRYAYVDDVRRGAQIQRLPLADLDTTRAIDGWETVKTYPAGGDVDAK